MTREMGSGVGLRVSYPQHAKASEEQKDFKGHRAAVRQKEKKILKSQRKRVYRGDGRSHSHRRSRR